MNESRTPSSAITHRDYGIQPVIAAQLSHRNLTGEAYPVPNEHDPASAEFAERSLQLVARTMSKRKVETLKNALASGRFHVDSERVAQAMLGQAAADEL